MLPVGAWEQEGLNRAEREMLSSVLLGVKEMWGLCRPRAGASSTGGHVSLNLPVLALHGNQPRGPVMPPLRAILFNKKIKLFTRAART